MTPSHDRPQSSGSSEPSDSIEPTSPSDGTMPTHDAAGERSHQPIDSARSLLTDLGRGVFWVVLLRGILAVVLGLLIFATPQAVALVIGIWVGAWLLIDGILTIVNANTARKRGLSWGWELTAGIAYVVAGIAIFFAPLAFAVLSGIILLWMMAFGMLAHGIFTLGSRSYRGWSKLLGVLDIIFAIVIMIIVFSSPAAAVTALLWIIGVYLVVFGVFLVVMAFTARSQAKRAMQS